MRALVINGKIQTTKAKAKAIQSEVEKVISLAKKTDVASRRKLYSILANDRTTTDFIIVKVAPVFSNKMSGFTRITNLPDRTGDNAQVVRLEWSLEVEKYSGSEKGKKEKKATKDVADKKTSEKKSKKGPVEKVRSLIRKK